MIVDLAAVRDVQGWRAPWARAVCPACRTLDAMTGRTATHGQPLDDARTRVAEEVPTDPRDASMGVGRRLITSIREDDTSGAQCNATGQP